MNFCNKEINMAECGVYCKYSPNGSIWHNEISTHTHTHTHTSSSSFRQSQLALTLDIFWW